MAENWHLVDKIAGIYRGKYIIPGTTPYSTAVPLTKNKLLVYSPGPGLEKSLPPGCEETKLLLLAPNIGHNLGVGPWLDAYPDAEMFAPEAIQERIRKKRGIDTIHALADLEAQLPENVRLHILPDNRFHEVWISIDVSEKTYWLIGDAFLNFDKVEANFFMKFLLGIYGIKPGLRLHKMFRLALKDKQAFKEWALPLFANERQHILLPCHREIYDEADCGQRMVEIIQALK